MALRQTNFSAGELDPLLQGRTDLPLFGRGLRTLRNFFVSGSGAAVSRPGSLFVNEAKLGVTEVLNPDGSDSGRVALQRFVAGDGESAVLEFGHQYMRVHTLGKTLLAIGGQPYELVTPYSSANLNRLRFAQVGDVVTVTHPDHPVMELKRFGPSNWTLTELTLRPPQPYFVDVGTGGSATSGFLVVLPLTDTNPLPWIAAHGYAVGDRLVVNGFVFLCTTGGISAAAGTGPDDNVPNIADGTVQWRCIAALNLGADTTHPAREWQWQFTELVKDNASGAVYETMPQLVTKRCGGVDGDPAGALASDVWAVYPDRPMTFRRITGPAVPAPPSSAGTFTVVQYNAYRGKAGVFGLVGQTASRDFVDVGAQPDYTIQPPQGTNPLRVGESLGYVDQNGSYTFADEYPGAVAFFQSRRCFAASGYAVLKTQLGVSGPTISTGRQGHVYLSATGRYTNFDLRLALHVSGEALDVELAALTRQENRHLVGINRLVVLTDSCAWVGGGANGPLDFDNLDFQLTDQVGAAHVVPLIVDGVVLFVRTKGFGARALVPQDSFTPYQGLDVSTQSRHLFVGNKRNIVDWAYAEDPWAIVWAVRADGALLSLTYSHGAQFAAWARHDTDGTYEAVCSVPEGDEDAVYVAVKRHVGRVAKRYIERLTSRVRRVLSTDPPPEFRTDPSPADTDSLYPTDVCLDCAFTYVGAPALAISGVQLEKLEGKPVYVVARGSPVMGPFVVSLGAVDLGLDELPAPNAVDHLGTPIWVAHVGLAYTCDLETLGIYAGIELKQKTLVEVGFELDNAQGVKAGQDFAHLTTWQQRSTSDGYGVISPASTLLYTKVGNTWNKSARVCLRQDLPLPVTVVGVSREVDRGD